MIVGIDPGVKTGVEIGCAMRSGRNGRREMPSESKEQIALFRWAALACGTRPELRLLFAIPNGGARDKRTGAMLKAGGVRPGVPDVCLPVKTEHYGGLWIELKRRGERGKPKGRPSDVQLQWLGALQSHGQCAAICYGWDEARDVIEGYLKQ